MCDWKNIMVVGTDEKAIVMACYELENLLNLRKGPFLRKGKWDFKRRFSPRMIHSGWDFDVFPDNYLRKIAHYGFDSVIILLQEIRCDISP